MFYEIQPIGAVGIRPAFMAILGAIVLICVYWQKHSFNLSEDYSSKKEAPMKCNILKYRAIFLECYYLIGSKVAGSWLLPARFHICPNS